MHYCQMQQQLCMKSSSFPSKCLFACVATYPPFFNICYRIYCTAPCHRLLPSSRANEAQVDADEDDAEHDNSRDGEERHGADIVEEGVGDQRGP